MVGYIGQLQHAMPAWEILRKTRDAHIVILHIWHEENSKAQVEDKQLKGRPLDT